MVEPLNTCKTNEAVVFAYAYHNALNNSMNDATKIFELYLESKQGPIMTTRSDGTKVWRLHSKLHREDAPAIERVDGTKMWFINDELHREDGPAIEWANGRKEWYINGHLHREDGPAIEHADGTKEWFINGKLHREDAPAFEGADGTKEWFINGHLHREDGPAIEYANGDKIWYINGKHYDDISAWAEAVLHLQNKPVTQDDVDELIAQVMQVDLFN